jgi:hypothetical protein
MPFGMGRQGWAYVNPWHHHWCHHWYGGLAPYEWPAAGPHRAFWRTVSKDEEIAMLEDEARALEQEIGQVRKRLEEIKK